MTERKQAIWAQMVETREQTLRLLESVPEAFLKRRVHDFYSPVGWHFGHIGMTEEFWVCHRALGKPCLNDRYTFLFANLPENPKDDRVFLPERSEIIAYLEHTRQLTRQALEETALDGDNPLLCDGYAWEFALQHECQHQETICELLELIRKEAPPTEADRQCAESAEPFAPAPPTEAMVSLSGGTFLMGSEVRHFYDNEKMPHPVTVEPFALDPTPVTAAQWLAFLKDGGYKRAELWTQAGWQWCQAEHAELPEYWEATDNGAFIYIGPQGRRHIHSDEPVSSISWYEADAYARWAGKRLPTEQEWEFAAVFEPETGNSRRFPWGDSAPEASRAAFGMHRWKPAPVGTFPEGRSATGICDLAGNVWEWTGSAFLPYPGFVAYPYDGYSLEHMDGNHFVCRGGSWATAAPILRCSFRNWYVPTYRQGILGMRCAR
ncbi:MAG: ergothioneine biosynthesis protein EgtB [Armatimonadaceae bacterium]